MQLWNPTRSGAMNTSRPTQYDENPGLDAEVMIRRNVASSCSQSLLTPPLQIQSILNSPLIKTNKVVPESEQSRIRGLLQDIENELETVNIQIARAQKYVLLLQDKRAGYIEDMRKLRPALAPHKFLPAEILIAIFLQYAAEIAERVINGAGSAYRGLGPFPWVLGQICSRWRQIALGEPRIWDTIGFNAFEHGNLPMLNEAFRRGGQSRLCLSASEDEREKYICDYFLRDVVGSQSMRLAELSLFLFKEIFEEFLSFPSDSFPALEDVQLVAIDWKKGCPQVSDSGVSVFQGAVRLRRINFGTPLALTCNSFPMNLCLCWPQLTHIDFPEISIQVSIAHELVKLCTNLRECHILLRKNQEPLPPGRVELHPPTVHVPHLWRLEILQEDLQYVDCVINAFLRPLVMPTLQRFNFSLEEGQHIDLALAELAAIVNGLSRPSLVSEMTYFGKNGFVEVTSALPFVTSLHAPLSVLTPSTIRIMTQKDHLPKLTSLDTNVAYADMGAFINMLETRWVRGMEARQSGCSGASIVQSVKIKVAGTPNPHSVSSLSRKIHEIQDRLKVKGAMIELRSTRTSRRAK